MARTYSELRKWVFEKLIINEGLVYALDESDNLILIEGLLGGLGSVVSSPFKIAGSAVKTPFKIAGSAANVAKKAAATPLKAAGNLVTLRPDKAVKSVVSGAKGVVKGTVDTASNVLNPVKSVGKSVKDIGTSLEA